MRIVTRDGNARPASRSNNRIARIARFFSGSAGNAANVTPSAIISSSVSSAAVNVTSSPKSTGTTTESNV
ncbi:MAG: hypothetical protein RSD41_06155 [Kiritimatiellia bacterium]